MAVLLLYKFSPAAEKSKRTNESSEIFLWIKKTRNTWRPEPYFAGHQGTAL